MPTFTDKELKMLTDANILRGAGEWGAAIKGAGATTGHAMTADAGQTWASNVTPEELANMTLPPGRMTALTYTGHPAEVVRSGPHVAGHGSLYRMNLGTGVWRRAVDPIPEKSTAHWSDRLLLGPHVTNPATLPHWSDDFAPLPVIDPSMLESRSEREDTIARIWDGMATLMGEGFRLFPDGTAEMSNCTIRPTNAAAYLGARDSDCAGIAAQQAAATDGEGVNHRALTAALSADYSHAQISDHKGIHEWHDADRTQELMDAHRAEPPKRPSNVKPAITGLGVTAPEDHRLGGWKQL
jgi:hypothetical protein